MTLNRIVLIGFMGSGKTRVGAELANRLGWRHIDLDDEVEKRAGRSVAQIFEAVGEQGFRGLEVEASAEISGLDRVVLSTGGGWVTNEKILEGLPEGTLTVWLQVSPETVVHRILAGSDQPERPLLDTANPRGRIEALMAERIPLYRRAPLWVDTEGRSPDEVVDLIEQNIRSGVPESTRSDRNEENDH